MNYTYNKKEQLIQFLKSLGICVKTNTKARGNLGIYFKNRIDVSKNVPDFKAIEILTHEFAHYIEYIIDPDFLTGGNLENLFCIKGNKNELEIIKNEMILITNFIDKNSLCEMLTEKKRLIDLEIKELDKSIKEKYPKFQRSKPFLEFDKYIKKSDARFLLKYDRVKIVSPFLKKTKIITIETINTDFPELNNSFANYIKLKSKIKKKLKIQKKITKLRKYYHLPNELFARFIETIFVDISFIKRFAPNTYKRFSYLYNEGFYPELNNFFKILNIIIDN